MKRNGMISIIGIIALVLMLLTGCGASAAESTAPANTKLTAAEAESAALKDAELTAEQVTGLRAEYEVDDGVSEYEVEFRSGDYEYDYTIHAETGAILRRDKDYDPPAGVQTTEPSVTEPPAAQSGTAKLTAEEAKAIALEHAGLTAEQVTGLRAEYEVDHGVPEYEVDFRVGNTEYDYEIHAESGEILHWDKDLDD